MAYYYTILTGQPPLTLSDTPTRTPLAQLKELFTEAASGNDAQAVADFFLKFDCLNLVRLLKDPENQDIDMRGTLSHEQLDELIQSEQGLGQNLEQVPEFMKKFPEDYHAKVGDPTYFPEDEILFRYYKYAIGSKDPEVGAWYQFNFDLQNVMTALVARKNGWKISDFVKGKSELCDALCTSTAADFGLGGVMPFVTDVISIAEETDPVKKEKKLDALKWEWLDEHTFFEPFGLTALIAYLARTEILERWALLDPEQGRERFTQIIDDLRGEAQIPDEFKSVGQQARAKGNTYQKEDGNYQTEQGNYSKSER